MFLPSYQPLIDQARLLEDSVNTIVSRRNLHGLRGASAPITAEEVATHLSNHAMHNVYPILHYAREAERAAGNGEPLPWERDPVFEMQDFVLSACRPSQNKTAMTQELAFQALKDRKP